MSPLDPLHSREPVAAAAWGAARYGYLPPRARSVVSPFRTQCLAEIRHGGPSPAFSCGPRFRLGHPAPVRLPGECKESCLLSSNNSWLGTATPHTIRPVPSRPIATSPAVADLLRHRRQALGLTLRAVEKLAADAGNPIPYSTLARVEQGLLDPGVKRLQQLLRLYQIPLQVAGDALDVEDMASKPIAEEDPSKIYKLAVAAWERGDNSEALSALLAFRLRVDELDRKLRQKATLTFAAMVSSLGKHRLAKHLLDDLLMQGIDPEFRVHLLLQTAVTWRCLGGLEAALAFLERAKARAKRGTAQQSAWILHEHALISIDLGNTAEARKLLEQALTKYQRANDQAGYGRVLGVQLRLLLENGEGAAAMELVRKALFHASRHRLQRIETHRRIDEGRAYILLGNLAAAIDAFEKALALAISTDDRAARCFAHYHLWDAYRRSGELDRARVERDAAQYYMSFTDSTTPEVRRMRDRLAQDGR